ncbi:MAG: hypothetical protein SP4CHLAM5_07710 [Chlamydiia bacterium]|nr:hypothetical protein [Chlamydiia bacterium]MCH9618636.1 hypothetical protein [Chlamydiia bacterium]
MRRYLFLLLLSPLFLLAEKRIVDLQDLGKIEYHFEAGLCEKIVRLSSSGEIKYKHLYHYNEDKQLISESLIGELGEIEYSGNIEEGYHVAKTPFGEEIWNSKDQSIFEKSNIEKIYDEQGRLIQKGSTQLVYKGDSLTQVCTDRCNIFYQYDNEGRKISKTCFSQSGEEEEYYLYLGQNEIGSISADGNLKWLRIPGISTHPDLVRAVAIETEDAIFAPIYDIRCNIVKLVNIDDGKVYDTRPDPFGQNLSLLKGCPWTFCSKRYDPDTHLVDFGYRYYDVDLKEWITLDPLMQDSDPYRYCFNNPLQFLDPDGRSSIVIPILTWSGGTLSSPLWGPYALAALVGAGVAYSGHEAYKYYQKKHGKPPFSWKDLGDDPSKCPGEGFEWYGNGSPETGKGNWVNPKTKEKLHPDFHHPAPKGPHWGYTNPNGEKIDIFPD